MSDTTNSWIKWVFGVIFVLALVALVAAIMVMATRKGNEATAQAEKDLETMSESRYTMYDGAVVTGSQVVDVITRLAKDKISIVVYNGPGTTANAIGGSFTGSGIQYLYQSSGGVLGSVIDDATRAQSLRNAKEKTSSEYINPSSNFYGIVTKDPTTDNITTITFQRVTD